MQNRVFPLEMRNLIHKALSTRARTFPTRYCFGAAMFRSKLNVEDVQAALVLGISLTPFMTERVTYSDHVQLIDLLKHEWLALDDAARDALVPSCIDLLGLGDDMILETMKHMDPSTRWAFRQTNSRVYRYVSCFRCGCFFYGHC